MGSALTDSEVLLYVEKIVSDPSLPAIERARVQRIRRSSSEPAVAFRRLDRLARTYLEGLPRVAPTEQMCRGVSVDTLRAHTVRSDVRGIFTTGVDLARYLDAEADPAAALRGMLPESGVVVFPWAHSWLAPSAALRGLSAAEFSAALEIGIEPPFAVFHLSVADMRMHDVLIRTPCSFDSVPGRNKQWRPGGPASGVPEFVDGDVPVEAISEIEWRR